MCFHCPLNFLRIDNDPGVCIWTRSPLFQIIFSFQPDLVSVCNITACHYGENYNMTNIGTNQMGRAWLESKNNFFVSEQPHPNQYYTSIFKMYLFLKRHIFNYLGIFLDIYTFYSFNSFSLKETSDHHINMYPRICSSLESLLYFTFFN